MPSWDEATVSALARRLRLTLRARRRQPAGGARLVASPGSSLEFHDHRSYQPGDDLRHLDWGVYGRTDQLVLRRHQREVSPQIAVLLDLSASMGIDPAKASVAVGLAALFTRLAKAEGGKATLWLLDDRARRLDASHWTRQLRDAVPTGAAGLEVHPAPRLSTGSERIVISDGLCPGGGQQVVQRLGRDAGSITLLQVMTRRERSPSPVGPVRLEDVEGGALDVVLDEAACHAYRARLARHESQWQTALRGRGAGLVPIDVERGLEGVVDGLVQAQVVGVRA